MGSFSDKPFWELPPSAVVFVDSKGYEWRDLQIKIGPATTFSKGKIHMSKNSKFPRPIIVTPKSSPRAMHKRIRDLEATVTRLAEDLVNDHNAANRMAVAETERHAAEMDAQRRRMQSEIDEANRDAQETTRRLSTECSEHAETKRRLLESMKDREMLIRSVYVLAGAAAIPTGALT
jgi:hypothetical protein